MSLILEKKRVHNLKNVSGLGRKGLFRGIFTEKGLFKSAFLKKKGSVFLCKCLFLLYVSGRTGGEEGGD